MRILFAALAFCWTVSAFAATSLMPEKGKNNMHGIEGVKALDDGDGVWTLRRETPGIQIHLRGVLRFAEPLASDGLTPLDAWTGKIRLAEGKEAVLQLRWRATDKTMVEGGRLALKGTGAFEEVAVPVPLRAGKAYQELNLVFHPDLDEVSLRDLAIDRPRDITAEMVNPPAKAQEVLRVRGLVSPPDAKVEVCVENAHGEVKTQTVAARDGVYELAWKLPPVTIGRDNRVRARIAGRDDARAVSLALPVFGFAADDRHVWLRVKGKEIVTSPLARGGEQNFVPVGVGYCKDVIIPGQDEEVMAFCKERGLNTVRLSFYTRFFNNHETMPIDLDAHLRDFVDPVVLAAKRHGLYVILDDHGYFSEKIKEEDARKPQFVPRWNDAGVAEWIERWTRVAERYKDEPNVLGYELLNEPHDIAPELTREWYTRCLKAIREVDVRHIVLMGTNDWSHARALETTWGPAAAAVDWPHNNVVFTFHDYPDDNHPWIVQKHVAAFRDAHNVPVLCTEFGATPWSKSEATCRSFISGMIAMCAKENVGWMIWAVKCLRDNPRNTYNAVDKVGLEPRISDSCAYSDMWISAARVVASPFPQPAQ